VTSDWQLIITQITSTSVQVLPRERRACSLSVQFRESNCSDMNSARCRPASVQQVDRSAVRRRVPTGRRSEHSPVRRHECGTEWQPASHKEGNYWVLGGRANACGSVLADAIIILRQCAVTAVRESTDRSNHIVTVTMRYCKTGRCLMCAQNLTRSRLSPRHDIKN